MKAIKLLFFVSTLFILMTVGGVAASQPLSPGGDTTSLPGNNSPDIVEIRSIFSETQNRPLGGNSLAGNTDTDPDTNFLGTTDNQPLIIKTNDTEVMHITPDGSVGIGTSDPVAKLQIEAVSNEDAIAVQPANSDEPMFSVDAMGRILTGEEKGDSSARVTINAENEDALRARVNGITEFMVAQDGQVGIGTSVPAAKLQINADREEDALAIRSFGNAEAEVVVDSEGNVGIGTTNPEEELHVVGRILSQPGSLRFRHPSTNNGWRMSSTLGGRQLTFIADPANGSSANRVTFEQNGNVGIGTTNPQSKLHVQGGGVRVDDSNFARIRMTATNPSEDVQMFIDARGDGTNRGQLGTLSNHDLVMLTNNQRRIILEKDGDICIGNC